MKLRSPVSKSRTILPGEISYSIPPARKIVKKDKGFCVVCGRPADYSEDCNLLEPHCATHYKRKNEGRVYERRVVFESDPVVLERARVVIMGGLRA